METVTRWVVPCYFTKEDLKTHPIAFDLTSYLHAFFINEVWKRKIEYGYPGGIQNTDPAHIKKATITIWPRFFSGIVNQKRLSDIIETTCGKMPAYLKNNSYKSWPYRIGCAIIEIEYSAATSDIPTRKDLARRYFPDIKMEFIEAIDRHIALLKEVSAFFLASLHLTFPSESTMIRNDTPLVDGFFQVICEEEIYCKPLFTSSYMHEVFVETSKLHNLKSNLEGLASVWHLDLWPLRRYLIAVESDQISMDNLLDLIYALEGLFEQNASADFIKTMCVLQLCDNKKTAKQTRDLLNIAFRMRNEIAHGARYYGVFEHVKVSGKEVLAQSIFWQMKAIVAFMIIKAISKLISKPDTKHLRFNEDDLNDLIFKNK
jgi:hypothetical protein